MVVLAVAKPIQRLPVLCSTAVHLVGFSQRAKLVVDRRQPDPFAAGPQRGVQLLGTEEPVGLLQDC
jgi:hypothetical protein